MGMKRASKEERIALKERVIGALKTPEIAAIDAGEVLVSIGAAMMKASNVTEAEYLEYSRKIWSAQRALGPQGN